MGDNISAFNAEEYDKNIKLTLPHYEDIYETVSEVVNVYFNRPVTWLDIGCGTGKMEEVAFKSCETEEITACDFSPKMTEITEKRFKKRGIKCITSSAFDLCADITFDVVTSIQVFHYLHEEERIRAIKKML